MRSEVRVLAICCLSLFIVGLDITAVNVALPSLGRDLEAGVSGLQWTVDAYTVVLASLLMLAGSTADRLGRRRWACGARCSASRWRSGRSWAAP